MLSVISVDLLAVLKKSNEKAVNMHQGSTQEILLSVFQELLGRPDLTVEHNLLDQGINSLQAVGASMLARDQGIGFRPEQIHTHPRIIDLAEVITDRRTGTNARKAGAKKEGRAYPPHPFTPTQRSWQEGGFLRHYNVYNAWRFTGGQLDPDILKTAVQQLCSSQDELRLRIYEKDGVLVQQVVEDAPDGALEIIDLRSEPADQRAARACVLASQMQCGFDFRRDQPLYRFIAFVMDEDGGGWFFILLHHYMVDGFGFGVLLRKLSETYLAVAANKTAPHTEVGSGMARLWCERMQKYAKEEAPQELDFWQSLPWGRFRDGLESEFSPTFTEDPCPNRFNEADAQELAGYQSGKPLPLARLREVFESQATVVDYLDAKMTAQFLGHNWSALQCNDFDVFALAASHAMARFASHDMLWLDMLGAARSGVFDDLDVSSTVGYISELTPFLVDLQDGADWQAAAQRLHRQRTGMPRQGVGLRAMKHLNPAPDIQAAMAGMPLPQAGINYHASLQYTVPHRLLDLPAVNAWLGATMDERGIAYRFWFRVSYTGGRLQIVMRYDPKAYSVDTAMQVVADTRRILVEILYALKITGKMAA
jgi:hypothetical protein